MQKNILHIANSFGINSLYANLMDKLVFYVHDQAVFCVCRKLTESSSRLRESYSYNAYLHCAHKPWHAIFFSLKINFFFQLLVDAINNTKPDIIHAHTLYSDGALAYQAKTNYGIPYLVAVRNSDLNVFARFRPDLAGYRNKVLREACSIVLISPAYKRKLRFIVGEKFWSSIKDKVLIIPNGIDDCWHENPPIFRNADYSRNKNVVNLLHAYSLLARSRNASITLVGGGSSDHDKTIRIINSMNDPNIKYLGFIKDKDRLKQIYSSHDMLVIPSFHETFGLSYIEALSQGIPCIHSRGEGIDGYFTDGGVSMACNPHEPTDILERIIKLKEDGVDRFEACIKASSVFNWSRVAAKYAEIYNNAAQ
jgi:glycosyltransferase involved in cell wall biosynthesis